MASSSSPVSIGCPLSPVIGIQKTKTFSKDSFKPSLHGATALHVQSSSDPVGSPEALSESDSPVSTNSATSTPEGKDHNSTETDERDEEFVIPGGDVVLSDRNTHVVDTPKKSKKSALSPTDVPLTKESTQSGENDFDTFDFGFGNDESRHGSSSSSAPELEDAFADNALISSPMPNTPLTDDDLNEDQLRSIIKKLIDNDSSNIDMSTKAWMRAISRHYGVDSLPKSWKGTVRDILVDEATTFTQTQTEAFPLAVAEADDTELEGSVGGHDNSSLFSDEEDDGHQQGDEDAESEASKPSPPKSKKSSKVVESEKNEELLVLEKMDAELSERDQKMMEYLMRDEDHIDSKTEDLRRKLQERNKQRMSEIIAAANLSNAKNAKALKELKKTIIRSGVTEHEVQVLKEVNCDVTANVDSSDDESDDSSEEDDDENDGCIALSDDSDDEDDNEDDSGHINVKCEPTMAVKKETSVSPRFNPFLRDRNKRTTTSASVKPAKRWVDEKQKLAQKAHGYAIAFHAKELGCESVEIYSKMLDVIEINKSRDIAQKRIDMQKKQEEDFIKEKARLERERKFREDMFLAQDDDSEGELDEEAEMNKAVTLEAVMKNAEAGGYNVDVDAESSSDENEEDDDEEGESDVLNEEERLAAALRKEEELLEKLRNEEAAKLNNKHDKEVANVVGEDDTPEPTSRNPDDDLVDSDSEGEMGADDTNSVSRKEKKKKKESKKMSYIEMIKLEEQIARNTNKSSSKNFIDDEAEEEEEEGAQQGLGDFGFKFTKSEADEERAALKLRKGELSHIVDDDDVDSGDEMEGLNRRKREEEKEDKAELNKIVTTLAEGYSGRRPAGRTTDGLHGQDALAVEGIFTTKKVDHEPEDDSFLDNGDDEQALAAKLGQMSSRVRQQGYAVEDVEELTDDSEDEEEESALEGSEMTEDERVFRAEQRRIINKQEKMNYKRIHDQASRNRALRDEKQKNGAGNKTPTFVPLLNLVSMDPAEESSLGGLERSETMSHSNSQGATTTLTRGHSMPSYSSNSLVSWDKAPMKRRTKQPPVKVEGGNVRPPKRQKSDGSGSSSKSSVVSGVLDKSQLDAGYGLGMCVSSARRKDFLDSNSRSVGSMAPPSAKATNATTQSSSLFAAVVGNKTIQPGLSRNFSGVLARSKSVTQVSSRGNNGRITVASQQYVFTKETDDSQSQFQDSGDCGSRSAFGGESSAHGDDSKSRQRSTSKHNTQSDVGVGLKRPQTVGGSSTSSGSIQQSALFSQITNGSGLVRASTSVGVPSTNRKRIRPSPDLRSKLVSCSHVSIAKK